jgi:excinuclease ABC subunit C
VFSGDTAELVAHFTLRMRVAAEKGEFEEAAILRDIIRNLQSITRKTGSRNPHAHRGVPAPETALAGLARCLGLPKPPRTIECFDVSNIAGCFAVGSMICYQNGRPAPQRYRRYSIRSVEGIDDYAMIREVILRRYRRLRAEGQGLPDLVMVDGGQGQLAAAVSALQETGNATLPIVALAKRDEELFLPGTPLPVRLPRHHPVLRLLQAIRDEAHRFALKYHLSLRHKRLTESILDSVPGISRARRTALLRRFGSVRQVCGATAQEIAAALPGTGVRKAAEILRFLSRKGNPPGT